MATKRKTYRYRSGVIVEVQEYHDGRYGAPGEKRVKKTKPTAEQMRKVNHYNKEQRCRQKLLAYINPSDLWITLTYEKKFRPENMDIADKHLADAMRKIRNQYKIRGQPLHWFANTEHGTRGAWHIHVVVNAIDGTEGLIRKAWPHGGVYISEIQLNDKVYDEDFSKLAAYLTKDEYTEYTKEDGTPGKPRIREARYSTSRNMPLPEPKVDKLVRWKKDVKPKKGYRILRIHEGINPVTGYRYRRYTMVRLSPVRGKPKEARKRE